MSLINDALNRAQAEASGKEGLQRGEVPDLRSTPRVSADRRSTAWVVLGIAVLILVALLAYRWSSTADPEFDRLATTTDSQPATVPLRAPAMPQEPSAAQEPSAMLSQEPARVQESSTPPDVAPPVSRSTPAARTVTTAAPEPTSIPEQAAMPEPTPVQETGRRPAPSPQIQADEPSTAEPAAPELPAPEPLAEIRAAPPPAESAAPPTIGGQPTTIWPSNGPDQETWYFVGRMQLAGGGEIVLDGIAWSELAPSAMLNGSLLTVGSEVLGLRVVSIAPRTVILAGRGQRIALQLASDAN